jgi:hypothetical protein
VTKPDKKCHATSAFGLRISNFELRLLVIAQNLTGKNMPLFGPETDQFFLVHQALTPIGNSAANFHGRFLHMTDHRLRIRTTGHEPLVTDRPLPGGPDYCTISASFLRHGWQLAASDFSHASRPTPHAGSSFTNIQIEIGKEKVKKR